MNRDDLIDNQNLYQEIVQNSLCLIQKISPEGDLLFVNDIWLKTLEYTVEEALTLKITQVFRSDFIPAFTKNFEAVSSGQMFRNFEAVFVSKSGREVFIEGNGSGIFKEGVLMYIVCSFRDITAHHQMELKLKEETSLLNKSQEMAQVGSWKFDIKTNKLLWSDEVYRIFGLSKNQFKGTFKSFLSFVHDDDKETLDLSFEKSLIEKSGYNFFFRITRPDGEIRYLNAKSENGQDKEGKTILSFGIILDITEAKLSEKILNDQLSYSNLLFEHSPDGMFLADIKGVFIDGNIAAEKLIGYKKEELIGKSFLNFGLIQLSQIPKVLNQIKELLRQKQSGPEELILIRKDGSEISVETWAHLVKIKDQNYILGSARDITERHLVEAQKRDLDQRLLKAQKRANLGFVERDLKTDLMSISDEAQKIYGIDEKGPFQGKEFTKRVIHPDDYERVKKKILVALKGNGELNNEYRIVRPDGEIVWIQAKAEFSEDRQKLMGTILNITKHKEIENKLIKSNENLQKISLHLQDEIEKERSQIALNLHDDLGQKLTALNMLLAVFSEDKKLDPTEYQSKTEQMQVLLEDCLASLSSISSHLRPSVLDNLGLEEALKWFLENTNAKTQLNIKSTFEKLDIVYNTECSSHIYRMVQESITNVLRHAKAKRVNFHFKQKNKNLQISIHDNGCGISPRKLNNPQSFGIYGMRERAKICGGSIEFLSKPRQGMQVLITLPLTKIKS